MNKVIILFGLILIFSSKVHSGEQTGNDLLPQYDFFLKDVPDNKIDLKKISEEHKFMGWINGVLYCYIQCGIISLPPEVNLEQIIDVFGLYLKNNPAERHLGGGTLFIYAIDESCPGAVDWELIAYIKERRLKKYNNE